MLRPHLPDTVHLITTAGQPTPAPPGACACHHGAPATGPYGSPTVVYVPSPAPRRTATPYLIGGAAVAGAVALVTVLTALLLAVALSAVSVAVAAVVLRSLLNGRTHRP